MTGQLADLLAATDPLGGRSWDWTAWRREVRPLLADLLDRLHDERSAWIRDLELGARTAIIRNGHAAWWAEQSELAPANSNFLAQDWHDRIELPDSWEISSVVIRVQPGFDWPSARLIITGKSGHLWPKMDGVLRVIAFRHGQPQRSTFQPPLRQAVLIGLPDCASPPARIAVDFDVMGQSRNCCFVLSSPGVCERLAIVESITKRPP